MTLATMMKLLAKIDQNEPHSLFFCTGYFLRMYIYTVYCCTFSTFIPRMWRKYNQYFSTLSTHVCRSRRYISQQYFVQTSTYVGFSVYNVCVKKQITQIICLFYFLSVCHQLSCTDPTKLYRQLNCGKFQRAPNMFFYDLFFFKFCH